MTYNPSWSTGGGADVAGTIKAYGVNAVPSGWLNCDGAEVSRTTYADLFAAIGITWGSGDGLLTFNVPDLRGRGPIGAGQGVGLSNRVVAQTAGEENHTLSILEMPAHTHSYTSHSHAGPYASSGNDSINPGTEATGSTGGGASHNNMQPFAVVKYIIKT